MSAPRKTIKEKNLLQNRCIEIPGLQLINPHKIYSHKNEKTPYKHYYHIIQCSRFNKSADNLYSQLLGHLETKIFKNLYLMQEIDFMMWEINFMIRNRWDFFFFLKNFEFSVHKDKQEVLYLVGYHILRSLCMLKVSFEMIVF